MINGEQESLLDTIKGLVDSYNNDTEAIKDEFTVAVYLERLEHYHIQLLDRHTEILSLVNVNFNLDYFINNVLKQASDASRVARDRFNKK